MENNTGVIFNGLKTETMSEKKRLFKAIQNSDVLLSDIEGEEIEIVNCYIEGIEREDEGEKKVKYRTIIFDGNGTSYTTTSYGIYNIMLRILSTFGEPSTWIEGLQVKVIRKDVGRNRKILTLEII